MGRLESRLSYRHAFLFWLSLSALTTGCSVAVPNVKSLLSQISTFQLNYNTIRIQALSELTSISVPATCDNSNISFEYELPETAAGTWLPVPSSPTGFFTVVTNNCATSGSVQLTLDLSAVSPFAGMALNSTHKINFRDINTMGISTTQEFQVVYSQFTLSNDSFNNGQGLGQTLTSGSYSLNGRVTHLPQVPISTSGSYSLQGKVVPQ